MRHKTVLVTGSTGQLGSELKDIQNLFSQYRFVFSDRSSLDLSAEDAIGKILAIHPDFIVNCAAYTAVDKAESEQEMAEKANVLACKHLVIAAEKCNCVLIHFSSDYVYHIAKKGPLTEEDVQNPQGVYAKTKHAGEKIIRTYPKHVIIRTSWVYSTFGNNFVKTMLRLAETKGQLSIVADQIGSPTYAADLALATVKIIVAVDSHPSEKQFGIFNYSNEGTLSWYDFAQAIFELKGIKMELNKSTTATFNAAAPRPLWSVMSKNKIKKIFGIDPPHWHEALKRCLERM